MSFSQIELVHVRVECECFWVNLREDNKVSESKMAVSESKMAKFKKAAIIKFSENAWVNIFEQNGWIQDGRIQDGCHHQVQWEWMSLSQIKLIESDSEWSESVLSANGGNQWMSEVSFVQMVGREVWVKCFCANGGEPILASVSEFERNF